MSYSRQSREESGQARTRLSTKGQLVVPKEIRERHGWSAGASLVVEDAGDHVVLRSAEGGSGQASPRSLLGCVRYTGPRRSLRDMEAAIAKGAARSR
jgi:AbrB family looped-hinge helix DNA binding protein